MRGNGRHDGDVAGCAATNVSEEEAMRAMDIIKEDAMMIDSRMISKDKSKFDRNY
jgi:hypothetical protein